MNIEKLLKAAGEYQRSRGIEPQQVDISRDVMRQIRQLKVESKQSVLLDSRLVFASVLAAFVALVPLWQSIDRDEVIALQTVDPTDIYSSISDQL